MTNNNEKEIEIDLLRLAKAIWGKAWLVAVVTILCGVITMMGTLLFITPQYEASVKFHIYNKDMENQGGAINASDINMISQLAKTYTEILKTRTALQTIIEAADVDYTYGQLSKMISAGALNGSTVYEVKVQSPDPQEAADIADAIADVMPGHVTKIMNGGVMNVLDEAIVPTSPVSPSIPTNMVIGMLLGFVAMCGVIVVMELLDDKIQDTDYLTQNYKLPVLAVIPDLLHPQTGSNYAYQRRPDESDDE